MVLILSSHTLDPTVDGPEEFSSSESKISHSIPFYNLEFYESVIGEGHFSTVRKARWVGSDVACKILHGKSFNSKSDIELYTREVNILRYYLYLNILVELDTQGQYCIWDHLFTQSPIV